VILALLPVFAAVSAFSWFIGAGVAGTVHYFISRSDSSLAESITAATREEAVTG
jgi:NCS1 family nucleobase:cation symporter-1